ncbi:MAG: hypothetical protein RLZ75_2031 [Pseudomonadota bacterium]|jgi:hypothetical protein
MNIEKIKLDKIIFECHKHIDRMNKAHQKLMPYFPLTKDGYSAFDDDKSSYLDQYLYRFLKLQDSIGQKLFKAVLAYKKEEVSNKSFIDIINRLEQLEYLQDVDAWFMLRDTRNQLAHDYEDDVDELLTIINKIFAKKELLEKYFVTIVSKLAL